MRSSVSGGDCQSVGDVGGATVDQRGGVGDMGCFHEKFGVRVHQIGDIEVSNDSLGAVFEYAFKGPKRL